MLPVQKSQYPRIRNKAKIVRIHPTEEQLKQIAEFMSTPGFRERGRRELIKTLLNCSCCCCCDAIPAFQIRTPIPGGGGLRLESYCNSCAKRLYQTITPTNKDKVAARYNCTRGEVPKTPPTSY